MRTFATISCPHCHAIIEQYSYGGAVPPTRYGSPLKVCKKCQVPYYDKRYEEPALKPLCWYEKNQPSKAVAIIVQCCIYIPLLLCLCVALYGQFINSSSNLLWLGFSLLGIMVIAYFAGGIYSMTHLNIRVDDKFRETYHESELRLKVPEYVEFLRANGVKVPN